MSYKTKYCPDCKYPLTRIDENCYRCSDCKVEVYITIHAEVNDERQETSRRPQEA